MSLEDANAGSFLDYGDDDFNETPDVSVLPDNTEVKVRLNALSMEIGQTSGKPYLLAVLDVCDDPDAKSIRHMMMWPRDDMDAKQIANAKRKIKYFNLAFGIPGAGRVEFEKYLGREATAILGVDPDTGYGESNRVKRWITGA